MSDTVVLGEKPVFQSLILVDDDERSERVISTVFRCLNFAIVSTANWTEGVELTLAQHSSARQEPVLLLNVDLLAFPLRLAVQQLRDGGFDEPIIALTKGALEQCTDAGCDDALRKPIDHEELLTLAEKHSNS